MTNFLAQRVSKFDFKHENWPSLKVKSDRFSKIFIGLFANSYWVEGKALVFINLFNSWFEFIDCSFVFNASKFDKAQWPVVHAYFDWWSIRRSCVLDSIWASNDSKFSIKKFLANLKTKLVLKWFFDQFFCPKGFKIWFYT